MFKDIPSFKMYPGYQIVVAYPPNGMYFYYGNVSSCIFSSPFKSSDKAESVSNLVRS